MTWISKTRAGSRFCSIDQMKTRSARYCPGSVPTKTRTGGLRLGSTPSRTPRMTRSGRSRNPGARRSFRLAILAIVRRIPCMPIPARAHSRFPMPRATSGGTFIRKGGADSTQRALAGREPIRAEIGGDPGFSACLQYAAFAALIVLFVGSRSGADDATPQAVATGPSTTAAPTEYWDLTARFEDGHRLFERFIVTDEGPGERTAGAVGYVIHPDQHVSEFRNGRAAGEWKLSPDGLRLEVASSKLDLHAPRRRLEVDSNSQAAKIQLEFRAGDGSPPRVDSSTAGFRSELMEIAAPIEGTISVRG